MKAKFIGKDNSMGFCEGQIYEIETKVKTNSKGKSHLWLYDMNSGLYCPYSRMETMLENWKLIE